MAFWQTCRTKTLALRPPEEPPATPVRNDVPVEAIGEIVVATKPPPKLTPLKLANGARLSVLETLAQVQAAYKGKGTSQKEIKKKPAAAPRTTTANTKKPANLTKSVSMSEHSSREAFCCRGPTGGKMFSYKSKSRKQALSEAVGWIKGTCNKLRLPVPPSKLYV